MAGKAIVRKSNSAKPKKGSGTRAKPQRVESKLGLLWGVGRVGSAFRKGRFADRFGKGAAVFMAAVLQYLTSEVLEMAGDIAAEKKRTLIQPKYIMHAIRNDEELNKLFAHVQVSDGGNKQHIEDFLIANKKGKKGGVNGTQEV